MAPGGGWDFLGWRELFRPPSRERSMSRHTRATTVASHPPRFSTPLVPERLRWSQDSWTASSASPCEPSSGTRRLAGGSGWPLGYWKVDDIQQSLQELLDAGAQAQQEMKD